MPPIGLIIGGAVGIGLLVGTIVIASVVAEVLKQTLPRLLNARAARLARGGDSAPELMSQRTVPEDLERRLDKVDDVERRLAEVEERLDFAERLLAQKRDPERVAPPKG